MLSSTVHHPILPLGFISAKHGVSAQPCKDLHRTFDLVLSHISNPESALELAAA